MDARSVAGSDGQTPALKLIVEGDDRSGGSWLLMYASEGEIGGNDVAM